LPEVKDMLLSLRRRLRCWRHTWGMHEVQLHTNVCRYCKEPWSKLYPENDPASIPPVPEPDPTVGHVESDTAPRLADTRSL
jgi:hypothetical protein